MVGRRICNPLKKTDESAAPTAARSVIGLWNEATNSSALWDRAIIIWKSRWSDRKTSSIPNTAKLERHMVDGKEGLSGILRETGQPVIIGGSMETGSYLLTGVESGAGTFYSTAHGSGRTMSRRKAKKIYRGRELQEAMEERGIYVRSASWSGLAEEAGGAYKDIDEVIHAAALAGINRPVCRFTPIGNIKG
jgi:RNA-splicing ligase RtcB